MPQNNEMSELTKSGLLDIFVSEEDKTGNDILAMSDFFDVFIDMIKRDIEVNTLWEEIDNIGNVVGLVSNALKIGFDVSNANMLVADFSHFGEDIINGLKNGTYSIQESKKCAGNFCSNIVNAKGRIVRSITLRKAIDSAQIFSNVPTLCIQLSLQRISSQIDDVSRKIDMIIEDARSESLIDKFMNARGKIKLASNASSEEQEEYLKEADTYLMEGLNSLYSNIYNRVKDLDKINKKRVCGSIHDVDSTLSYIDEDMKIIPRYLGLRTYLFHYRGKFENIKSIFEHYSGFLHKLNEARIYSGNKYTAFELIHEYYQYNEEKINFWLEKPKQIINSVDSYKALLTNKSRDILCLEAERLENE